MATATQTKDKIRTRKLASAPSILPLYARAALPLVPGASHLPFVPGGGGEIPDMRLELDGVVTEPANVAAYAKVCGFTLRDSLPPTYPHVLAFPLHMALMSDGSFPFGAVGLVHIANRISQYRRLGIDEELSLRVQATKIAPHPKGKAFDVVTEARVGRQIAWESTSTFLSRGKGDPGAASSGEAFPIVAEDAPASAEWTLPGDLGRRYAAVSGDRNPIHMHSLTAKPLGFPAAIAHGMWTKARALAALEARLPDAFAVDVRFRRPILLPAKVEFATQAQQQDPPGEESVFTVRGRGKKHGNRHLDGRILPVKAKTKTQSKANGKAL
jgi:acyl dehydratase